MFHRNRSQLTDREFDSKNTKAGFDEAGLLIRTYVLPPDGRKRKLYSAATACCDPTNS